MHGLLVRAFWLVGALLRFRGGDELIQLLVHVSKALEEALPRFVWEVRIFGGLNRPLELLFQFSTSLAVPG